MIRVFFDACHRHGWLLGLAASATIYVEELPFHHDEMARFIPEFVMAQLESEAALAQLPHRTTRNLVVVLIETGLRRGDACNLAFNSVIADSTGWPCLRFEATKVRAEQLVPLSAKAADDHPRPAGPRARALAGGSPWLFPGHRRQPRWVQALLALLASPASCGTGSDRIDLHDEAGQPVQVSAHQFRHTFGTRLINAGVPQHVVQRLLGHASPNMTGHYARRPRQHRSERPSTPTRPPG